VTCSICGRRAPCEISQATGGPWCKACQKRRARCAGCGQIELIRGGTLTTPLCAACTRPDPSFWRGCPGCGHPQLSTRSCTRCNLRQRLRALLADGGDVRAGLRGLHDTLAGSDRPNLVLAWLNKTAIASILREFGTGQRAVSHAALDELPPSKPVEHLRAILVAAGTLPARDEHLARLERWIARTLAERADPEQRQLLHRYAVWHLLRRLRQRNTNTTHTTHAQAVTVKRHINAAIALLGGLATRGRTLADARQGDLDAWLTSDQASHRRDAGHFARWANRHKLTSLEFPATRWQGPARTIDTEARWAQARWLLHDHTVNTIDRVAGLLVLLYAQTPAAISRLTLDHVQTAEHAVRLRLGPNPITLPEPLAGLVLDLAARRRGHAALGDQGTSRWLFPGGRPGQPISAYQLAERLRQLRLSPAQSRTTALFGLATELPAAMLARLLGIHIKVAVAWQHASAGDWTTYAARYSRRKPATTQDPTPATQARR